jgi:ABC-type spermidine/putrescine transport system permease subunit II
MMGRSKGGLLAGYSALVFAFLYLPIAVLILYSFNGPGVDSRRATSRFIGIGYCSKTMPYGTRS